MDINTYVEWVESVKATYGTNAEEVMEAHLKAHPMSAQITAGSTISFGLDTDDSLFMNTFKEHGGDIEYLQYLADCYIKVRSKYFGL